MSRLRDSLTEAQKGRRRRQILSISGIALIVLVAASAYLILTYLGRLTVTIAPDDAVASSQIELLAGRGIVLGDSIIAVREPLNLRVSADGFQPEEVTVSDATWRRGELDIVLKPRPAKLIAEAAPELSDLSWYLDGALVAQAPSLSVELQPGQYAVGTRHPHFESAGEDISLERGQSLELSFALAPVQGSIEITSVPSGAGVTLDSISVGQTPLQLDIEGGQYQVGVSYLHHVTQTDSVAVTTDTPQISRHYELAAANREVTFILTPADGLLTVDYVAVPLEQTTSVLLPVNSRHTAQYSKPGFRSQQVEFAVSPDSSNRISMALEPIYGQVEVISDPVADVSVGGALIGQTPLNLRLQTVPQTITVSLAGYVPESRTITPDESFIEQVYVTLVSEESHRLSTSPADYVNSIGMEFKLFKQPDSVRMGSNRGEAGHQVNEFIRQVRLTRPFYAGVHEVTIDQYRQFSASGQTAADSSEPITGVSWMDAARFCNWLSSKEGFSPVYQFSGGQFAGSDANSDGYRMLTEAEWEWLARKAGRLQQTIFPWGNTSTIPADSGNLADESVKGKVATYIAQYNDRQAGISDTGLFQPNPAGIHDLVGNVSEWTHDAYSHQLASAPQSETDPFDTSTAKFRTIKGSNWQSAHLSELRAAFRRGSSSGDEMTGFRVARYLY